MDEDRFLELLAKKKFNSATLSDIKELKEYLNNDQIDPDGFDILDGFPEFMIKTNDLDVRELESKWNSFLKKAERGKKPVTSSEKIKLRNFRWLQFAALFIAVISFGLWFWDHKETKAPNKQNVVGTRYGSKSRIEMPDGSIIWLNAGSKLTYDDQYSKSNRTVHLVGEAYFDVKHDGSRPFLIYTKDLNLKVLGTAFNVKAYPDDRIREASLIRGSLEVSFPGRPTEKIVLKPNEKIELENKDFKQAPRKTGAGADKENEAEARPIISLTTVSYIVSENAVKETSWVDDKLIFRNEAFKDLAREMERWYDITILFKDSTLDNKKFTGTFKNETFIEALDVLRQTYPFDYIYNKENNTITITN